MPFELYAYEALITTVKCMGDQDFDRINNLVQKTLIVFKSGSLIPLHIQEEMRSLKNELSLLVNRLSSSKKILTDLTEDDEEMALMNLTKLRKKPELYK